jgi:hypothetical protein
MTMETTETKARIEAERDARDAKRLATLLTDARFYARHCLDSDRPRATELVRKLEAMVKGERR